MQFRQLGRTSRATLLRAADALARLATLERVLALVCISIPAFLIVFDHLHVRNSISEYYSMQRDQTFYFSLTVASMLFVVNGVVKEKHLYNTILGTALAGVVLFNCHDAPMIHVLFASIFFGGNGVVILFFSSRKERPFKVLMSVVILVAMLGWFVFHWVTLFWAEWVSLAIIAIHYFIEAGYGADERLRVSGARTVSGAT